jgi:hypothetical protein
VRKRLAFVALLALAAAADPGGCVRNSKRPTRPASPLTLAWISPSAGDTVAGLVSLEVEVRGTGFRSVAFLAAGAPVDTATAPPWTGRWRCRGIDAPTPVRLSAVIQRENGSTVEGGEITVAAVPNHPPTLALRLPRPATWLERTAEARIEAVATDPEEGPLPPGRVHWTGPALARPVTGTVLPLEILAEEEQWIALEAADRWNECARETLVVRPFRYVSADTPAACAANAAAAIRALDPAALSCALADSFLFVPCAGEAGSAPWPPAWNREAFLEMAARWLRAPSVARVEFDWGATRVDEWQAGSSQRAWMECAGALVRFREVTAATGSAPGTSETLVTAADGSVMQLSLRRESGGSWRIAAWRELATGGGRSFAGLLASTAGLPAPRAGAGCEVRPARRPGR